MSVRLSLTPNLTLNEVARACPLAVTVFENAEIDYSCKGERTLADAASDSGYRPEELIARLENADDAAELPDWFEAPLSELTAYLVSDHVTTVSEHLPAIRSEIGRAMQTVDHRREELARIGLLFEHLAADLVTHVQNEERELFPCIQNLALARTIGGAAPTMRISQRVLHELIEHETFRDRLHTLLELAERLPDHESVLALRSDLRQFKREVNRHMHLENNVLYPRAIAIENTLRRAAAGV